MKTMPEQFDIPAAAFARPLAAVLLLLALGGCARNDVATPKSVIRPVSTEAVDVGTTHLDLPALPQLPERGWM